MNFPRILNQLEHSLCAVLDRVGFQRSQQLRALVKELEQRVRQRAGGHVLLHQHPRQPLPGIAFGVFDLVAPACSQRIGYQQHGLVQGQQLAEGVAARAAQNHVGHGQRVGHLIGKEFLLAVAFHSHEAFVQVALAAQVKYVKAGEQLGQGFAQAAVDALCAQAAARHEQHGFLSVEPGQRQPGGPAAAEQLRPERGARQYAFFTQRAGTFGEGRRHLGGKSRADAIRQAGSEIAFMAYGGHAAQPRTKHHRHAHKAALGEAHIRLQAAHDGVIGDVGEPGHHLALDAALCADIVDFVARLAQMRNQAQMRGHVPGGAAPRQYDAFAHGALLSW